jgi:tetratricopeptide (TPR) repeat protein
LHDTCSIEDSADFYFNRACTLFDDDPVLALKNLATTLEYEPNHLQALILAAELHLYGPESLGLAEEAALHIANEYLNRALAHEPRHAETWSVKAIVLFYQQKDKPAIEAADQGLSVLPLRIGFAMQSDAVFSNIAEALHNVKVKALLELGRPEQARLALAAGFAECPQSALLTRRIQSLW